MGDDDDSMWGADDFPDDDVRDEIFQQHEVSPPHRASQDDDDDDDSDAPPQQGPPPPSSSFLRAFSGTVPARSPSPTSIPRSRRRVRHSLREFWEEHVPDSLKTFNIPMNDVFKPICMTPTEGQVMMMASRSKCMELLREDHPSLLSSPNKSFPLCFVARAAEGLPIHMQKVLFFFTSVNNSIIDMGHYAAPTIATGVLHDKVDPKVIRGLASTGRGLAPDQNVQADEAGSDDDFISMDEVLEARVTDHPDEIKEPVLPLSIHIGFTGVVFNDEKGQEKREVFSVLTVTPADGFALVPYILEKFLQKPKMGAQKYEQILELYLESSSFFKEIMRYECFCNLAADERKVGLPEDYYMEPGGRLGTATVLSPFQIPLKIYNIIKTEHPGTDLASIRIIGCPRMTFKRTDATTKEWLSYMNSSINTDALRQATLLSGIDKYDNCKDKNAFPDLDLKTGGWPIEVGPENKVLIFGLPPLPLMHKFDSNGARGNFSVFIASIGDADLALPDLTRAILTSFLVHSSEVDARPEIDHLLKDKRKANPLLVLRTYYGPDADPFSSLVLANRQRMWSEALRTDIQVRRSKGATIQDVLRISKDYLASAVKNLESMVECQVFRSATVIQMKAICDLMSFEEVCTESSASVRKTLLEKSKRISIKRRYDSMYRSWNCFMKVWEDMNHFFSLNSGNLLGALEVMLSQLMFKFADTNETWTFFFVSVVVMAGNGHYQTMTPEGPVPCRVKPNTTGMDFLLARVMDVWNALYEKLMIPPKDRHNLIVNCMRFTATVWENLVTAQAAAGRLIAVPPADANFQTMSLTEIRDSLKPLIQYGPPRGPEGGTVVSFNSQEVNTTRVASRKRKLNNNNIVVISSNVGSKNNDQKEEGNTLDVVCAVIPPGVPAPAPQRLRTELNDTDVNANTARNQPLENRDMAVNCIAYTSNFAGLFVGLLNHIGAMQTEVNPVVSAFYDWGCYYIKQFVSSSMDVFVRDNFSRMREGYKSRGVVMTIWLKTQHALSLGKKTKIDAIQHLWMDIQTDALTMVHVPIVFCNLLYRGVHMASLLMTSVIADHLKCPVVNVRNLNRFFELEAAPDLAAMDDGFKDDYAKILEFVRSCFVHNRFCPADDAPFCNLGNVSCYISGDANGELMPANPKTSLLRVPPNKDKDETHDISHKVALRIASQYGEQLFGQCHMGPDVSTYRLALVYLAERFAPDFRGLMSAKMFHSAKHLACLGLERGAPGMTNYMSPAHPPFARQCNIRVRDQLQSQAIGVNLWSLLTVVSLIGSTDIHPDVSNGFANNLVQTILSHAPTATTPGDMCPTPRFDHSATATRIFIPGVPRPKHFLRPEEPSFVKNGVLPIAKACGRFLPEDMLHVSQLSAIHKLLHCDIMEVPANAFTSPYALEPDLRYTFHVPFPDEGKYGLIHVNTRDEKVTVDTFTPDGDDGTSESLSFTDWEEAIREKGIVITPLIRRAGAAVVVRKENPEAHDEVEDQAIGCLIPNSEDDPHLLDISDCTYNALVTPEMDTVKICFLDVLKRSLLPVGEVLYLDMKVLTEERYKAMGMQDKVLYTRLNVPNVRNPEHGKLYVTCLHQPRTSQGRSVRGATAITLAVNPWDVQLASAFTGDPASVVKNLS